MPALEPPPLFATSRGSRGANPATHTEETLPDILEPVVVRARRWSRGANPATLPTCSIDLLRPRVIRDEGGVLEGLYFGVGNIVRGVVVPTLLPSTSS